MREGNDREGKGSGGQDPGGRDRGAPDRDAETATRDAEIPGDPEPDLPEGIRYDPDLAVHEPAQATDRPIVPGRKRSPLLLFVGGLLVLSAVSYVLFGLLARETRTSSDYLNEIRVGRGEAWRSAYELSRMLPDEDPRRRDPALVAHILSLLDQAGASDARLRRYLVLSLGQLRDPASAEALVGALQDTDAETRLYAAWGLAAIGAPDRAASIVPLLEDPDPGVRKMGAYALGVLQDPAAAAPLRAALNDPVDEVAWNAALALARLRDPAALPLLGRLLDRHYLETRTRTDEQGRAQPIDEGRQEELLINALRAAPLLGAAGLEEPIQRLRDGDRSPGVRQAAIEALRQLGAGGVQDPKR